MSQCVPDRVTVLTPPTSLQEMPLELVEAELCRQAGQLAAATCRWLDLVATFDRRQGYESWGMTSTAQWLSWRCAVSPGTAREQVRVARALHQLPQLRAAFAAGRLSYSQVRAISRVAAKLPQLEDELVQLARECSAAHLEEICRGIRVAEKADTVARHRSRRFLRHHVDDDGYVVIHARLTPDDGAIVLAALHAAQAQLDEDPVGDDAADEAGSAADVSAEAPNDHPDGGTGSEEEGEGDMDQAEEDEDEDDPYASSRFEKSAVDALLAVAESFLTHPTTGSRVEPQVIIQIDLPTLDNDAPGTCRFVDGPALHPDTARRLCCQAGVVPMLVSGPFDVLALGRATRVPSTAQRRALQRRDGGRCRFPGCRRRWGVEAHHIIFWSRGGRTDLDNLILLCKRHHIYMHEGGYRITSSGPATFAFHRPDGTPIPSAGLPDVQAEFTLGDPSITADTIVPDIGVDHRKADVAYTVDSLLHVAHRPTRLAEPEETEDAA